MHAVHTTTVKFGELPEGAKCRLGETIGHKIRPIEAPGAKAFYTAHNSEFWGWNFAYRYYIGDGQWGEGHYSLGPDTEVVPRLA